MAHVIKNHHGITDDKNSLIQIQIIRLAGREFFKVANHFIAQEAYSAAVKPGQAGNRNGLVAVEQIAKSSQRITVVLAGRGSSLFFDNNFIAIDPKHNSCVSS